MSTLPTVDELRAKITDKGPWFDVSPLCKAGECERCDADDLYWILTKKGKRMLVDCGVKGGKLPRAENESSDEGRDGRGVSHFATCPHAAHFSHRAKP
jgi:hypothetical protein